jgi:hypothetical protein
MIRLMEEGGGREEERIMVVRMVIITMMKLNVMKTVKERMRKTRFLF